MQYICSICRQMVKSQCFHFASWRDFHIEKLGAAVCLFPFLLEWQGEVVSFTSFMAMGYRASCTASPSTKPGSEVSSSSSGPGSSRDTPGLSCVRRCRNKDQKNRRWQCEKTRAAYRHLSLMMRDISLRHISLRDEGVLRSCETVLASMAGSACCKQTASPLSRMSQEGVLRRYFQENWNRKGKGVVNTYGLLNQVSWKKTRKCLSGHCGKQCPKLWCWMRADGWSGD